MAKPKPEEVLEVFHHWIAQCKSSGKGRVPVLGDKRRRKIEKAIELYGLDACKDAIRGVTYSSWHMGHNPQGKKYDDIELILRDEKHIEMFLELADEHDSDFDTLEAYANGKEPF
ncbi:MAG TPA: hypothetical protein DEP04_02560 [Dehalococcoidia bacterium]|nr:hypothetical protein [Gammaproteobacteria bacterium]HCE75484.1 hypothetical protein [Dehalococcoidia bacterium]|tara:strand:- start:297 stop:641 length:345 start_codon:yes stop_codon:yes gene_type:complete